MASASTKAAATKPILTPSITLKGHGHWIESISYFPDGQRMISGSQDKTARQWDLKAGKEIEEARGVCKGMVLAVAVSRDGRWAVTGGGDCDSGELKACEVQTGIVKTFEGHSPQWITCVDISADKTLLAGGSWDKTARIWNLDTGKLVSGPFKSEGRVGAVQFSADSKKLAVKLVTGKCLEIWDVWSRKLDAKVGNYTGLGNSLSPVFWTNNNKTIIAAFSFTKDDDPKTIYEFDGLTLETVGSPFEGHTDLVRGLALSFDGALLASTSQDNTIKLWAFESRQLLASFDAQDPLRLILSPDSRQLAYATTTKDDCKICICDTPPDVLSQARVRIPRKHVVCVLTLLTGYCTQKSTLNHLLHVCISFFYLLHHLPIAIIVVSCNSSTSCRALQTTDIHHTCVTGASAYKIPAATLLFSPQ
jgi:WD40 repeat protein